MRKSKSEQKRLKAQAEVKEQAAEPKKRRGNPGVEHPKNARISEVRFTQADKELLKAAAKDAGYDSFSDYIRETLLMEAFHQIPKMTKTLAEKNALSMHLEDFEAEE